MQLGMIGLGRMGANIVRRSMRGGHDCVVYDVSADAVGALEGDELKIPGRDFGFRRLIHSQAAGDFASLEELGRRIVPIRLEDL